MQLYFSHSYRDVAINSYFIDQFRAINRERPSSSTGETLELCADQKTDVWCVAKLERYLFQLSGFVSVIPRRRADGPRAAFSEYIAYELTLARRSRAPRLLFVDDQVLRDHRDLFPRDAVPFLYDAPQRDRDVHVRAIRNFKRVLGDEDMRRSRMFQSRQATVIAADQDVTTGAAASIADVLRAEGFEPTTLGERQLGGAFDDIRVLEALFDSELCVFLLGERLSNVDLLLAMAHAQCVPSIRFRYDPEVKAAGPDLAGVVRWKSAADILEQFQIQIKCFRRGFVLPLQVAADSTDAARRTATTETVSSRRKVWNPRVAQTLLEHLTPDDSFVTGRVSSVSRDVGGFAAGGDRAFSHDVCRRLYDEVSRRHFYYELEPPSAVTDGQVVRTPNDIDTDRCATCLDLACLFASLLEAAHQRPLIAIVGNQRLSHALAGFIPHQEIWWEHEPSLGELRAALRRGEATLFEATGAVESDGRVGDETDEDRRRGEKMLDFTIAKEAAERTLFRSDVSLTHIVDVAALRRLA
jgi:hypothetical protein